MKVFFFLSRTCGTEEKYSSRTEELSWDVNIWIRLTCITRSGTLSASQSLRIAGVDCDVSSSQCCNLAVILLNIFMKLTLVLCTGVTLYALRAGLGSGVRGCDELWREGVGGRGRGLGWWWCSVACQLIDTLSQRLARRQSAALLLPLGAQMLALLSPPPPSFLPR